MNLLDEVKTLRDRLNKLELMLPVKPVTQEIIYDQETGLEWLTGPDEDTDFADAEKWIDSLGDGWAMPKLTELGTLYQEDVGSRNMSPLFTTSGWFVWASDPHENSSFAFEFSFNFGGECWGLRDRSLRSRVFAVRPGRLVDNLTT